MESKKEVFIEYTNSKNKKWLFFVKKKTVKRGMRKCGIAVLISLEV